MANEGKNILSSILSNLPMALGVAGGVKPQQAMMQAISMEEQEKALEEQRKRNERTDELNKVKRILSGPPELHKEHIAEIADYFGVPSSQMSPLFELQDPGEIYDKEGALGLLKLISGKGEFDEKGYFDPRPFGRDPTEAEITARIDSLKGNILFKNKPEDIPDKLKAYREQRLYRTETQKYDKVMKDANAVARRVSGGIGDSDTRDYFALRLASQRKIALPMEHARGAARYSLKQRKVDPLGDEGKYTDMQVDNEMVRISGGTATPEMKFFRDRQYLVSALKNGDINQAEFEEALKSKLGISTAMSKQQQLLKYNNRILTVHRLLETWGAGKVDPYLGPSPFDDPESTERMKQDYLQQLNWLIGEAEDLGARRMYQGLESYVKKEIGLRHKFVRKEGQAKKIIDTKVGREDLTNIRQMVERKYKPQLEEIDRKINAFEKEQAAIEQATKKPRTGLEKTLYDTYIEIFKDKTEKIQRLKDEKEKLLKRMDIDLIKQMQEKKYDVEDLMEGADIVEEDLIFGETGPSKGRQIKIGGK